MASFRFVTLICSFFILHQVILAHPHRDLHHAHKDLHHAHALAHHQDSPSCVNPASIFDYSVKKREDFQASTCEVDTNPLHSIVARQSAATDDDYSCSETKPCSNGACCSKKTGYCNYGPDACGPDLGKNPSPNEVCWSNCDAVAECGRYALPAGKECPLNVCCSSFGFCGMTDEFCKAGDGKDDDDIGCQSNCKQPGSGSSDGDMQSRVIGYYEAWAHDRDCQSMDFKQIPAGAFTHLYFSFGYITPGDFNIAPMDDLKLSLFADFTEVKNENADLKAIVALGGWTFNDNGTATQPVFSDMVSSVENRAMFIANLMSFMREYAFDGVDFDWEYPGAPDRGGHEDDGKNFVTFLKELKEAISKEPVEYTVSFTSPTSYWYLRWFDLSAVEHVDWINVMSYDLHGIWDSTNPIGSHVLAHTNLTETKQALDLFWRNDVPANKINLGFGFYGRSFQLSDPSCYKPGCMFKGGADPGSCTKNSGTLSFREIQAIIDQFDIEPYWDKEAAVKYITWNQDQWVSYDDEDTFKQKLEFGNKLGIGGMLIWSIDQDTDDLKALSALLAPKDVTAKGKQANDAAYWQDVTSADCYVTDCGGSCKAGFLSITKQPCGGAKPVTRHSKGKDSSLCCPITAAPDPDKCTWRGSAPSCNGHCNDNEVAVELNRWGDGDYCEDGNKAYCCEVSDKSNQCYWTGVGKDCRTGDETFTFAGTFLETVVDVIELFPPTLIGVALDDALSGLDMDLRRKYCCPPDDAKKWKNCAWHGEPGSCFDNHCDLGHQVQLTSSDYGLGESCFPRSERTRVYCCDAADGESPFLPVPLEDLFPHPPEGDDINVDSNIQVDNTWGTGDAETSDDEPNDSTFGFVVLASPKEIQISLDKRDGADWELFNCNDATSEEAQTIQIYCGNENTTKCDEIHLGHGVPGTILEMPPGCGPSKYAVAKSLVKSDSQHFPNHLEKRSYAHKPTIYDLTFDFEWRRVPRDMGETQMRLDYSNEVGYWDSIVNKAASKKRKRSLEDAGGNHKRWLEEEWRDDMHHGALSASELHKRWFGEDVLDWLRGLFNSNIKPEFTHNLNTVFTAKLIEEDWTCNIKGVDTEAHLLVQALLDIDVKTSFGITIIATLGDPISFQDSYLYFKNKGEVSAIFTLDALGRASFGKDLELLNLANFPGATFSIPKLVTIGPNFRLIGRVDAEIQLSGHLESRARIASWDIQQTYPSQTDYEPKDLDKTNVDGTGDFKGLSQPTFDYQVSASGSLSAHLKPTIEFGITFDDMWKIPSARVQVIADGSVTLNAEASSGADCPFTYSVDVGARLYCHTDAKIFNGWNVPDFDLYPQVTKTAIEGGTCPSSKTRRSIEDWPNSSNYSSSILAARNIDVLQMTDVNHFSKRAGVYGPPLHLPRSSCLFCPVEDDADDTAACDVDDDSSDAAGAKRDISLLTTLSDNPEHLVDLEKRDKKDPKFCGGLMQIVSPNFDPSGTAAKKLPNIPVYGFTSPNFCKNDFSFGLLPTMPAKVTPYSTEHILEFQLVYRFLEELSKRRGEVLPNPEPKGDDVDLCSYMTKYWYELPDKITAKGYTDKPIQILAQAYPSNKVNTNEWVLLWQKVNSKKEGMWGDHVITTDDNLSSQTESDVDKLIRNIAEVLAAWQYHMTSDIATILTRQRNRVAEYFDAIETALNGVTYDYEEEDDDGDVEVITSEPYQIVGLRAQWEAWSSDMLDQAESKARTYMDENLRNLQNGYASDYQRDAAAKAAAKGDKGPQKVIAKIDALAGAVNKRPTWQKLF